MKTADHLTPIRGASAKIIGSGMGMEPKRDRWLPYVVVLAAVGMAFLIAWGRI